jgi:hypothetical protein
MAYNTNKQYFTLDSVVRTCLIDIGDETLHRYQRFLHWGILCMQMEVNNQVAGYIKGAEFTMSANKTLVVPDDFIDVFRIGLKIDNSNNTLNRMSRSYNLLAYPDNVGHDNEDRDTEYKYCEVVGDGGEVIKDYYYLNRELGVIRFSSEVKGNTVYMEYLSTPYEVNSETKVHVYLFNMVRAYILYQYATNDDRQMLMMRKTTYHRAKIDAKIAMGGFTTETLKKIIEKNRGIIH